MTLDALNELNNAFAHADADKSGTLDLDEFKEIVRDALKIKGRV
jgi:Ca2+-binding EF-hand superfamily protein